jgi:mRNA-degrading endonuclease RelE of RelBE toxin-antitoxin system
MNNSSMNEIQFDPPGDKKIILLEKIKTLSPQLQQEVEDFIQFLIEKHVPRYKCGKKLRQDWAGALRDYKDRYSSMSLQKKSLEWRED